MGKSKGISYAEARAYAIERYERGGDVFVECWDETAFDEYVKMFGPVTKRKLRQMFGIYDEQYKVAMQQ